jgi:hypothetical protein
MDFDPSRIRRGEALAGAGAVALLVLMFVLQWYGPRAGGAGPVASLTGWQAFAVWRWLALATVAVAFCLVFFQASRRAPALPVSTSMVLTPLALLTAVWLAVNVLFDHPPNTRLGSMLGLISACVVLLGAYLSLREEGIAPRDGPTEIPTVRLAGDSSDPRS